MNGKALKAVMISGLAGFYLAMEKVQASVRPVEAEVFFAWLVKYFAISFIVSATWVDLQKHFNTNIKLIIFWYLVFILFPLNSALFTELIVRWIQQIT